MLPCRSLGLVRIACLQGELYSVVLLALFVLDLEILALVVVGVAKIALLAGLVADLERLGGAPERIHAGCLGVAWL